MITGIAISVWGGADSILKLLGASPGFIDSLRFPWHPWMIMGLGNIASFTVGWLASLILPAGRSAAARLLTHSMAAKIDDYGGLSTKGSTKGHEESRRDTKRD